MTRDLEGVLDGTVTWICAVSLCLGILGAVATLTMRNLVFAGFIIGMGVAGVVLGLWLWSVLDEHGDPDHNGGRSP